MRGCRVSRWMSAMILRKCPECGAHMGVWDINCRHIVWRNRICPVCRYDAKYDGCWVEEVTE